MTTTLAEWKKERIDRLAATAGEGGGVSLWVDAWRRLVRSPVAVVGAAIIVLFVLVATLAPLLAPYDPAQRFPELLSQIRPDSIPGPSGKHPLGSDPSGRDFLSRLIYGSRQTLFVGFLATLLGLAFGTILGGVAGAFGGWVDVVLMRVTDVLLALPGLLLAIGLVALAKEPSQWTVITAIAIVTTPVFGRLLRGSMLSQRERDHVLAARALGVKEPAIVLRHVLPNSLGPVIVQGTLTLGVAILDAAALSFLGLGDQDFRRAEWGYMLGVDGYQFLDVRPALAYYPALCIVVLVLGFTLLGESMREALDPKSRR